MSAPRAVRDAPFFAGVGYSSVWEDEALVAEGLRPRPGERALCVTSGGCFALQLLLAGAGSVLAVDWSPHQSALLQFKVAALRTLSPSELWQALGLRPVADRQALYRRLREALPAEARAYWDARPGVVAAGVAGCGKQDRYLHAVGRALRWLQGSGRVRRLLEQDSLEAQRRFYDEEWSGLGWRALCAVAFSRAVLDRAFDPAHFTWARAGAPGPRFRAAAERLLREVPAADNFYLHYLFTGTYPSDTCCPAWLARGAPEALRPRLDRLTVVTASLDEALAATPSGSLDLFGLSNAFDWVLEEAFERTMAEVVRTARPGARLYTLTNLVNTPRVLSPDRFPAIEVDEPLSRALDARCRTPGYSGCTVATVRG